MDIKRLFAEKKMERPRPQFGCSSDFSLFHLRYFKTSFRWRRGLRPSSCCASRVVRGVRG